MNFVWNYEGVKVGSITMNRWDGQQMWTSGFGLYRGEMFTWEASALTGGWLVEIVRSTGRVGSRNGVTMNLPLEIAATARMLL